jgi:flavodoxin
MESIIIFYSLDGNTRKLARKLAESLSADILELRPQKEIDSRTSTKYLFGGRQAIMRTRPPLEPYTFNDARYDLIIIGTPVWALTYAPPLRTFLSSHTFKDKHIGLFCTHEGAPGRTLTQLRALFKENTIVFNKDFNRSKKDYEQQVDNWIQIIMSDMKKI